MKELLLTIEEAEEQLLMKNKTVYDWIYKHKLTKKDTPQGLRISITQQEIDSIRKRNEERLSKIQAKNVIVDSENEKNYSDNVPRTAQKFTENSANKKEFSGNFTEDSKNLYSIAPQYDGEIFLKMLEQMNKMQAKIDSYQDKIEKYAEYKGLVEHLKASEEKTRNHNIALSKKIESLIKSNKEFEKNLNKIPRAVKKLLGIYD